MSPTNAPPDMSLGLKMTTSLRTTTSSTGVTQITIIDQILLPHTTTWLPITSPEEAHAAIKRMQIRGAPAIASLAALAFAAQLETGLAASQSNGESKSTEHEVPAWFESEDALKEWVIKTLDYLNTARPTAVNLGQAMRRLRRVLDENLAAHKDIRGVVQDLVATAHAVADEDVGRNRAMAKHGAEWLLERVEKAEGSKRKLRVMTVCNTGSLATSVSALRRVLFAMC
jgi:methylthioribose-1-phosphate isomerase